MTSLKAKQANLPYYISLLLVIALGISLAKLMWLVLSPVPKINASINLQTSSNNTHSIPPAQSKNFGKIIANLHLFGEVKKAAVAVKTPTTVKPDTPPPVKLDLKLHGIVAYTNRQGFALISSNGKAQKVYGQGDKIDDNENVTISKLFPEKVLINNHGTIEELVLPSKTIKKNARPSAGRHNPKNSSSNYLRPPTGANKSRRTSTPGSGAPDLSKFRQQVLANPAKLMDVATPSPAYNEDTDEFIGFRVRPGSNRQIFRQIGLKANDIITSVNGIALDSPQKGAMVLGELQQASSVTIEVKRGDQILTLSHSF